MKDKQQFFEEATQVVNAVLDLYPSGVEEHEFQILKACSILASNMLIKLIKDSNGEVEYVQMYMDQLIKDLEFTRDAVNRGDTPDL